MSRYEFEKYARRYRGDYHIRELSCWKQFVQLLFGQITSLNSLRDICLCLKAHKGKLYHLGIKQNVVHTTLSRAGEHRDWRRLLIDRYILLDEASGIILLYNCKFAGSDVIQRIYFWGEYVPIWMNIYQKISLFLLIPIIIHIFLPTM